MAADNSGRKRLSLSRKRKSEYPCALKCAKKKSNEDSFNGQLSDSVVKQSSGAATIERASENDSVLPSTLVTRPLDQSKASDEVQPHNVSLPFIDNPQLPSREHQRLTESKTLSDNTVSVSPVRSNYFTVNSSFSKLLLHNGKEQHKKPTLVQATLDTFWSKGRESTPQPLKVTRQGNNKEQQCQHLNKQPLDSRQQQPCMPGKRNSYSNWRNKGSCPQYKWIPGTSFTVDAFCYGIIPNCEGYFLTHFHSDHYMGLNKHFQGNLYCSKVTYNLVCSQLKVSPSQVRHLSLNKPVMINGISVILLEANHCPGSVMLLFILPDSKRILHTGDFRATSSMATLQPLIDSPLHTIFLDTTYCNAKYSFPSQDDVIQYVVDTTLKFLCRYPKALVVCGTYTIGKEKIFKAIAHALECKVHISPTKMKIIECLECDELTQMCTRADKTCQVHVMPMNKLNYQDLRQYLDSIGKGRFNHVLAFKPTGWTHSSKLLSLQDIKPLKQDSVTIYGVPYSEHSSYSELKEFVQCLRPSVIVSTVGGHMARSKAQSLCIEWMRNAFSTDHTQSPCGSRKQIQTRLVDMATFRLKH